MVFCHCFLGCIILAFKDLLIYILFENVLNLYCGHNGLCMHMTKFKIIKPKLFKCSHFNTDTGNEKDC